MRLPWPAVAAGVALVGLGAAGLIRASVPAAIASGTGGTGAAPIVVSGAYVRPPVPPTDLAAAYFTVYNTTAQQDTLTSVTTGAGATAVLHLLVKGVMSAVLGGVAIPAHSSLVLSAATGHLMIGQLFGPLRPGQSVNLDLTFANAGAVSVTAPVIGFGSPGPPDAATPSSSGVHT